MAANKRWVRDVKTVSTFPPPGTFAKDARTIARIMASKKVSPKGIGSGIRMIQFFINRAGKNLPPERKQALEEAKHILQEKALPRGEANRLRKLPGIRSTRQLTQPVRQPLGRGEL
jgi:tRNA(adenine34) deaminase